MVNLSFAGPNGLTQSFNWVFLLELIVVVIVVVFLLFFFNRVFGFVVSYIIRTYTWHRHKAYIHVDAIQLSFLAGRILFKNFRYQSRNQSIYLLKGHLTWRYWIRRTRVRQKNCQVSEIANLKLPCRVHLEVEGVEWFVYNRTPAYDEIIAVVEGKQKEKGPGHENGGLGRSETTRSSADRTSDASLTKQDSDEIAPHKAVTHEASFFLHLLPISLVAKKGAIILGNTNTPSIVVAQFVEADMAIDAAESRSKFDLYKMVYNVNFTRPTVQIKMNIDYKESLLDRASHVVEEAEAKTQVPTRATPSLWRTVRDMIPFFQESTESLAQPPTPRPESSAKDERPWAGLPRYSTRGDDEEGEAEADTDPLLQATDVTEYAKVTTVLDSAELYLSFYYDEPGCVPPISQQLPTDEDHIGNGDMSPEWGLDMEVTGGTISYGPWTDRQRAVLQEMFFPGTFQDATLSPPLKVGDRRIYAYFKVLVEFKDSVIFKIPTKEKSKDWKFSANYLRSSIDQRVTTRPFGWIELKANNESTITYHMGLTPRQDGWTNFLNLELKRLRVTTSINYGIFTEAEGVRIQCDLSNPLKWDALHNWIFNITIFKPSIFLLRDHITLFSDCGSDFTSAPTDYATWIPYIYTVNINFFDFSLFLNVNDGNIISAPSELNDNSYVTFRGAKMSGKAVVPSDKISPVEHSVQFEWQCPAMALTVHAPLWNTLSVLLSAQEIGQLHKLEIKGSYTYPSGVSRNNIETLDMQASASYVSVVFYGFLLRYFFNVRNNYFGDHTQFVTLEEYQREAKLPGQDQLHAGKRPPVSNVLDVIIAVEVAKGAMILPSRLYEVSEGVRMHFDMLEADVRFMDYYMDLQINISPASVYHHLKEPMDEIFEEIGDKIPQAFVDGVLVHAHRLLGKPPSNPAYVCNWDFDIGMITGEAKIPFLQAINLALDSFVYNLIDVENALPELIPPDRDITFLRVNAAGVSMRIPVETEEIRVQLGPTTLGADDRTSLLRSLRATIAVQSLAAQVLHEGKVVASFNTALRVTTLGRRPDLLDHGPKQANHVRDNDAPSRRAWFLYSRKRGHAQDDLDTFEIDLPPLAAERIASIHSRVYTPKCTLAKGKSTVPDIHLAGAFLAPDYGTWTCGTDEPRRPSTPAFKEETPLSHSSYSDIVLTHVDDLPALQKTLIVEVSADTALLLTPDVIHAAKVLFEAMEMTDPVAALDLFQRETVAELLLGNRDRSTVTFAEIILPRMQICLQGNDGLGLLIDIVDLAPQFRSVHYKLPSLEDKITEPQESSISLIASLRSADVIVYRHNNTHLTLPDIPTSQRDDLAHVCLQQLDVKVRQGFKILGSVAVGDIEATINAQEVNTLVGSVEEWMTRVDDLSSTIDTTTKIRVCKSRNLVASIVLAGEERGVSNDPPFLTRPSHVLRISKNLLRVNDSWKIMARVRHIGRSLPPEIKETIADEFVQSSACSLNPMDPVLQILSKWRSWELSNIQETYFFKWLSGAVDDITKPTINVPIEGVFYLGKAAAHFDTRDGKDNAISIKNVVVSCTEPPNSALTEKAANILGLDINCEDISLKAGSDIIDLVHVVQRQQSTVRRDVGDDSHSVHSLRSLHPAEWTMEYRGTVQINRFNMAGHVVDLGLSMTTRDLRVSAFSQLRRNDEIESPSFCLSFQQFQLGLLDRLNLQKPAAQFILDQFSSQMLSVDQRPGVAASLESVRLRLLKPIPWLITEATETIHLIKTDFGIGGHSDVPSPHTFQKPNLPLVTFRLHQASIKTWLVPDALRLSLASTGCQTVLGELDNNKQWGFFDVPPATISIHRTTGDHVKLAEAATPFVAIKTLLHWSEGLCKIDPDIQVGILSLSMTSLASIFQTLASEEVISHLTEIQKASQYAQTRLAQPEPVNPPKAAEQAMPIFSYRVRSIWESIQVVADAPDAKMLFACSDIYISLSNRSTTTTQRERILFTAGSRNTSISLLPSDDTIPKSSIFELHWEVGNSISSNESGTLSRLYLMSNALLVTLSPRTVSLASRAVGHIVQEVEKLEIRQTLKDLNIHSPISPRREESPVEVVEPASEDTDPFQTLENIDAIRVSFSHIKFRWIANDDFEDSHGFTFRCKTVDASVLDRATRGRFTVHEGELELNCRKTKISSNHARLPKLDFNVHRRTEQDGWQLQLDAHGDTVQVDITPNCIETGHAVLESITSAAATLREDFPSDNHTTSSALTSEALLQQTKRLKAVVTSIDFSGARINAKYDKGFKPTAYMSKYRVAGDGCDVGALHIPGLALRSRYSRKPRHVFHAEICILQSTNFLSPQIKPFIHDILHRLEGVMSRRKQVFSDTSSQSTNDSVPTTAAILGDLKFSVGLRVQSQELTLTCDPFSKVDANVGIDEIYAMLISFKTANHNQTFAVTMTMSGAHASLQHQYSGIASANVKLRDLSLSMFNNYQIRSAEPGISAVIKSSAFEVSLNARQGQDFLIFNTLWLEGAPTDPVEDLHQKRLSNPLSMQQLQKVTASPPAFPINVTVLIDHIKFAIDLGQSIGTTDLEVHGLRISNRKCSKFHHCIFVNMDSAEAESRGRFSGYMKAQKFMVQTSIYFQAITETSVPTPLVQIDMKLGYVEFRASFEYHVFLIGDSDQLRFTIYNRRVRSKKDSLADRLVFLGDSELLQLYATAEGPALVLSLYKAVIQLQEEKEQSRMKELASFNEGDNYLAVRPQSPRQRPSEEALPTFPHRPFASRVDMEMAIKFAKINIGIFKAALNDSPVFRVNVSNIRALFAQTVSGGALENQLDLALGTLGIALSPLKRMGGKELGEMKVEKWIKHVSSMRGGVILAVPETEGSMWTKQEEGFDIVEHIFKSRLDGKVDIGWNYGSVMYVQELWKTFELKLKQSDEARVTHVTKEETEMIADKVHDETFVSKNMEEPVTLEPDLSKVGSGTRTFTYVAVEPAIIETPQLRQMGEATPPMEWIGVNRMRLPAFTHQAFIVPLQRASKRVETLYNLTLSGGR